MTSRADDGQDDVPDEAVLPAPPRRRLVYWLAAILTIAVAGEAVALYLRRVAAPDPGQGSTSPESGPVRVAGPVRGPEPATVLSAPTPTPSPVVIADLTYDLIASVTASSYKPAEGDHVYTPDKAFDGLADTAWNEGADGPGTGEWIEARFKSPAVIDHVVLTPGWDYVLPHGRDLFTANRHMTEVRLEWDDGSSTFHIPDGARQFTAQLGGVKMSRLRIVAVAVNHDDAKWDDLAISEVRLFGTR